jgi:hypothetical protein
MGSGRPSGRPGLPRLRPPAAGVSFLSSDALMVYPMRVFLTGLLALMAFAAGCMGPETGQSPDTTAPAAPSTIPAASLQPGTDRPTTTIGVALQEDEEPVLPPDPVILPANITACAPLENATLRDLCFYDQAGRSKDMTVCDKIADGNFRYRCRARLEENSDYCESIDTLTDKDWCFRMMAFKWNKIKYCKMVFYQGRKDKCVLDYVKDKKPDPYECFQITDSAMRDDCIYFHIDLYDRTGAGIKPTLCNLINNGTMEAACNQTFLGGKKP